MDDRRALMAAILANPDEDTPRLVLADWLDEHGDKHDQARAEFIRLQIEERPPRRGSQRDELVQKTTELVKKHRKKWLAPLGPLAGVYLDADVYQSRAGCCRLSSFEVGPFQSKLWQRPCRTHSRQWALRSSPSGVRRRRPAALAASPAFRWVAKCRISRGG